MSRWRSSEQLFHEGIKLGLLGFGEPFAFAPVQNVLGLPADSPAVLR